MALPAAAMLFGGCTVAPLEQFPVTSEQAVRVDMNAKNCGMLALIPRSTTLDVQIAPNGTMLTINRHGEQNTTMKFITNDTVRPSIWWGRYAVSRAIQDGSALLVSWEDPEGGQVVNVWREITPPHTAHTLTVRDSQRGADDLIASMCKDIQ